MALLGLLAGEAEVAAGEDLGNLLHKRLRCKALASLSRGSKALLVAHRRLHSKAFRMCLLALWVAEHLLACLS